MANITYRQVNDYMIPNLKLPHEESDVRLGKWGMLHKDYLKKHNRVLFFSLLAQGKLFQYCAEIEKQAQQMFDTLIKRMKESDGVTEQLKEQNQLEWIQKMNNIQQQVKEIICEELIYA